jgi:hypothetical protein
MRQDFTSRDSPGAQRCMLEIIANPGFVLPNGKRIPGLKLDHPGNWR